MQKQNAVLINNSTDDPLHRITIAAIIDFKERRDDQNDSNDFIKPVENLTNLVVVLSIDACCAHVGMDACCVHVGMEA